MTQSCFGSHQKYLPLYLPKTPQIVGSWFLFDERMMKGLWILHMAFTAFLKYGLSNVLEIITTGATGTKGFHVLTVVTLRRIRGQILAPPLSKGILPFPPKAPGFTLISPPP